MSKRDIYKKTHDRPFKYPEAIQLMEQIQDIYWRHTELSFASDKQDVDTMEHYKKEGVLRNMLAISTIEVAVKSFWGQLGTHFGPIEWDMLGQVASESECYDKETQVLTNNGFKLFKDLENGDLVAQYDIKNGKIDFVKPLSYLIKPYKGVMHHYFSNGTDLMVTPNHDLILKHPSSRAVSKRKSSEGIWGDNFLYPCSGYINEGNSRKLTNYERLLIALQADGSMFGTCPTGKGRRDWVFSIKKERKVARLLNILKDCKIDYNLRKRQTQKGEYTVISGKLPEMYKVEDVKTFGWVDTTLIDSNWSSEFFEELEYWDATRSGKNIVTYYNANEKAVDKLVEIGVLTGYSVNKGINRTAEQSLGMRRPSGGATKSTKDAYAVNIYKRDWRTFPRRTEVEYDDLVYCVTVPKGNIVTRRGKRTAIAGNCRHYLSYSHLLGILGMEKRFEEIREIPAFKGRYSYLDKYLKLSPNNSNPRKYIIKLILFSCLMEHTSLFGQFVPLMYYFKKWGKMKDIKNIIEWTAVDESTHFQIGATIVNILREEHPEYFDEELNDMVKKACLKSVKYEKDVLDWVWENGELEGLTKANILSFMKNQVNSSMLQMGFETCFEDVGDLEPTSFFFEEVYGDKSTDFFAMRPTDYTVGDTTISADDLF